MCLAIISRYKLSEVSLRLQISLNSSSSPLLGGCGNPDRGSSYSNRDQKLKARMETVSAPEEQTPSSSQYLEQVGSLDSICSRL